jgi:Domain of unknown function (DUF4288)
MSNKIWYSAQCVFLHADKEHGPMQMYEERIILLRANNVEAAIKQAENEAKKYSRDLDGCEYLGYVNIFELYDQELGDGAEIFSIIQKSDLKPREYLDIHYPEKPDDCETTGETHRWHNLDDKRSSCYHCKVIREGNLWQDKKRGVS